MNFSLTSGFTACSLRAGSRHGQGLAHKGTPEMPHPQLSERFDAALGTIQLRTAREMRGAGGFLHLQPHLAPLEQTQRYQAA